MATYWCIKNVDSNVFYEGEFYQGVLARSASGAWKQFGRNDGGLMTIAEWRRTGWRAVRVTVKEAPR